MVRSITSVLAARSFSVALPETVERCWLGQLAMNGLTCRTRDTFAASTAMAGTAFFRLRPGLACNLGGIRFFLLELRRMAGQRHALNDAFVLRTPGLEVPNRPEPPMIHHVLVLR